MTDKLEREGLPALSTKHYQWLENKKIMWNIWCFIIRIYLIISFIWSRGNSWETRLTCWHDSPAPARFQLVIFLLSSSSRIIPVALPVNSEFGKCRWRIGNILSPSFIISNWERGVTATDSSTEGRFSATESSMEGRVSATDLSMATAGRISEGGYCSLTNNNMYDNQT